MREKVWVSGLPLVAALLTLLGSLAGGAVEAYAATYYVDGSCQYSGNGLADQCASAAGQAGAKKTGADLHSLIDSAACGDTIIVKKFNGVYSDPVGACSNYECGAFSITGKSCTASNKFTLKSADRTNKAKLCTHSDCSYDEGVPTIYVSGSSYVVIDGFEIDGAIGFTAPGGNHNEVAYNDVYGGMRCDGNFSVIFTEGTTNLWVHHNYFHDLDAGSCSGNSHWDLAKTFTTHTSLWEYNTFRRGSGHSLTHVIDQKDTPNGDVWRYNDIEGGIVVMRQGAGGLTGNQIYGNVFHNRGDGGTNTEGITVGGGLNDIAIHHNTIQNGSIIIEYLEQGGATLSADIHDNIVHTPGSTGCSNSTNSGVCYSTDWSHRSAYNFNHNIYSSAGRWRSPGADYTSLASWISALGAGKEGGSLVASCAFTNTGWPGDWHITGGVCKTASSTGGEVGAYGVTDCVGNTCGGAAPVPVCGNGVKEGTEVCDGGDLGGASCGSQGFYCGTLQCNSSCSGYVTSSCVSGSCGDGQIQAACGEQCDSANLGGQTCQGLGYASGTLACGSTCGFDTTACAANQSSLECANWQTAHPDWIWCDDFEYANDSALLSSYDDSGVDYTSPTPAMGVTPSDHYGGAKALRFHYIPGAVDVGYLWRHFGRNPAGSNYSNATDFTDVYWRFYMKLQPNWTGQPWKITRATGFYRADRSQTFVAHYWQDQNPQGNGTSLDPVSCVSGSTPRCTGYNDGGSFTWLGERDGVDRHLYDTANAGQWRCMEFHVRLNTPGSSNGVQEYWIDGVLQASRSDLNLRGSYTAYGINAIQLEAYWNPGAPVAEDRYYDNFVVSQQRVGCGTPPGDQAPPPDVQNLNRTDQR